MPGPEQGPGRRPWVKPGVHGQIALRSRSGAVPPEPDPILTFIPSSCCRSSGLALPPGLTLPLACPGSGSGLYPLGSGSTWPAMIHGSSGLNWPLGSPVSGHGHCLNGILTWISQKSMGQMSHFIRTLCQQNSDTQPAASFLAGDSLPGRGQAPPPRLHEAG